MDGRIDEIARRRSGFSAEEIVEQVFTALGAGDPDRFEVFRTRDHVRAQWVLRQCSRNCPDFSFIATAAEFFCFRTSYVVSGSLREKCSAVPKEAAPPGDPARLRATLERLAGESYDTLVEAAHDAVENSAFDDGVATFRARLDATCAKAIVRLLRAQMRAEGFDVYVEKDTTLGSTRAVRIMFKKNEPVNCDGFESMMKM